MRRILIGLLLFSGSVGAQYSYDYKTGNSYNVSRGLGTTTVRGYNTRTGSTWTTTYKEDSGRYRGRDSKGNYFNGNNDTGYYYNMGTGKTCYGKGSARTCY